MIWLKPDPDDSHIKLEATGRKGSDLAASLSNDLLNLQTASLREGIAGIVRGKEVDEIPSHQDYQHPRDYHAAEDRRDLPSPKFVYRWMVWHRPRPNVSNIAHLFGRQKAAIEPPAMNKRV
jgi:hypothetical protein